VINKDGVVLGLLDIVGEVEDVFDTEAEPLVVAVLPIVVEIFELGDTLTVVVDVLVDDTEPVDVTVAEVDLDGLVERVPDTEPRGENDGRGDNVGAADTEFVLDSVT
jgi:hypothetical protein